MVLYVMLALLRLFMKQVATKAGVILLSDNEQYEGGKALWQHMASFNES